MAEVLTPDTEKQENLTPEPTSILTPLIPPEDWTAGQYASFPISPEPMFGPDELGEYRGAIDDLDETVTRSDSSARMWEVLQAWEARLFSRGYHFNTANRQGWSQWGGVNGSRASGAEIMQTQNTGKMFPCNVYGARQDKANSILAMEIPGLTFVPKEDSDPIDQTAADEKKKYLKAWMNDAGIKDVLGTTSDLFWTDGRVCYLTWSEADEQQWGTETSAEKQEAFGAPVEEGVTPETENQSVPRETSDQPAVREVTRAYGKLECKVPIGCDHESQMAWLRISTEQNANTLKERYPWIEDKITAGSSKQAGADQMDRMARINVRLAVQVSNSSGESWQQDATEAITFYRPSQYRAIKNKDYRKVFQDTFPLGLMVIHAGGELAFCQNRAFNRHLKVIHAKKGSGQNRRAMGTNYLPLQKILNANLSLFDRYMRSCIPRRFAVEPYIDVTALNGQTNDPAKVTPVTQLPAGQTVANLTGIENVPQPTNGLMEFIQWLISGAPEAMDGMEPAMFGAQTGENDQGVFQTAKLKRDAARGVYSQPWSQICIGLAKAAEQAAQCAAENRVTDISSNVPGQGKITVEIAKMNGDAYCYPESMDIPQTIAEQEAQMAELLENGQHVAIYQAIAEDPRNLTIFANFPSLGGLEIPGLDAVEQQQGELELLMQSGPLDNPQVQKIQQLMMQAQQNPETLQTPEGQQALQEMQQALKTLPPKVSSVTVAQDGSENHAIHAAVTLGMITSAEGRKLKNGNDEQKNIWQNLKLHWQEHVSMSGKLTPPKEMEFKGSLTVDPSKFSPEVQAKVFQAAGLQVSPEEATGDASLVPHEVTTEKEGVDEQGIPVKQKVAMVGKGLR